jgi:YrbI family 3-deoxy-D-manno-octulosonate 8-phosphate phosphatase
MKLKLIIYDFDGVMTNNKVEVSERGIESVICHRDDGWAVGKIHELGMNQLVLSLENNPVVAMRCMKLDLTNHLGCENKAEYLCCTIMGQLGFNREDILYVGNSLNDLDAMQMVGYKVAPADAHPAVKKIADYVTEKKGGEGVILELYEKILKPNKIVKGNIRLRHVGLVTDDVRASKKFYNALGFTTCVECDEDSDFINKISQLPYPNLTTYKLTNDSGDMIELLDYHLESDYSYCHGNAPTLFDRGCAHFALTVPDIEIVRQNLEDIEGVCFLSDAQMSIDKKALVMFIQAPEGSFVELVEEIK